MALGNNVSMGQARGKNKPVLVKRRKEVVLAKSFNTFTSSVVHIARTCLTTSLVDKTYYCDGSSIVPGIGDKVYAKPRANDRYLLQDGHYKVFDGRARYIDIEVAAGVVQARVNCR